MHFDRSKSSAGIPSRLARLPAFATVGRPFYHPSLLPGYAASLLLFALALVTRLLVGEHLPPGFPYLTFFPAVILTAFIFGLWPGVLVAVLSGLASWYFFISPQMSFGLSGATALALAFYTFIVSVDIAVIHMMHKAYRQSARAERRIRNLARVQTTMIDELDHRIKNVFATVSAIISLSQKHAASVPEFASSLRGRLDALGRSNAILRGVGDVEAFTLGEIITTTLSPYGVGDGQRIRVSGPEILLTSSSAVTLSLIFHELGTNAVKYGALSQEAPEGFVKVSWTVDEAAGEVRLNWCEEKGLAVAPPSRVGFGSELLSRMAQSLDGDIRSDFRPHGLECELTLGLGVLRPAE